MVDKEKGLTAEEEEEKVRAKQSRNMRLMIYLSGKGSTGCQHDYIYYKIFQNLFPVNVRTKLTAIFIRNL